MSAKKHYAKLLHLGIGVHSFGNATTLIAKPGQMVLEITSHGILATSIKFSKKAFIPYSNIKAVEVDFKTDFTDLFEHESIAVELIQHPAINTEAFETLKEALKEEPKKRGGHIKK